ncbi:MULTISPECIES: hypothetical protein [unclassified Adlercreutzia]|uniref:hypothetical protein n=1 Tax=unclassified Adlercreutzia TaxID=2636013 RepID=UPI0013E9A8D6|nr:MULTISPECIES: hypothetical protein [unclassified Adlercreutzia]
MSEKSKFFGKREIDRNWFIDVVKRCGTSVNKLGDEGIKGRSRSTLKRCLRAGCMDDDLLDGIAKELNVHPDFLAGGDFAKTLTFPIMEEEGVREHWKTTYLNPAHFPYSYAEQEALGTYQYLMNILLMHDVSKSEFNRLSRKERMNLAGELDRAITRVLRKYFQSSHLSSGIDYRSIGAWKNEDDVIETMLDYLTQRGLITDSFPPSDDEPDMIGSAVRVDSKSTSISTGKQ